MISESVQILLPKDPDPNLIQTKIFRVSKNTSITFMNLNILNIIFRSNIQKYYKIN